MMKFIRQSLTALLALFAIAGISNTAQASLSTDLQTLNTQALQLQAYLQGVNLAADEICAPLNEANDLTRDMVNSITTINDSLAAPLQVDAAVYDALDELFATGLGIANEGLRLSFDLQTLSSTAEMMTLNDGISAMLQLSTDIGTMADRIGEMADNILVMSDNIGLMADRILVTQQLQSQNVALTTDTILQTQSNVLSLVSVIETSSYDLDLAGLITEGNLLAARMMAVSFSPWTMAAELEAVATDVRGFLTEVQTLQNVILRDSASSTLYVSDDTLLELGNLSLMLTSLSTAVDGYVIAIEGLQAITSTPTLEDSMSSMLSLSGDIGIMANRILEMADQILVMSDNIGLQADQILLTQEAMNINVAITQTSILAAQEMAIAIIVARNI